MHKNTKHGHTGRRHQDGTRDAQSPTYFSWHGMKSRCTNPRHDRYKDYGGRGITVCAEWMTFENFLIDMGERPAGHTLERLRTNEGYHRGNCVWATRLQQANNTRTNRTVIIGGNEMSLADAVRRHGRSSYAAVRQRIHRGWSPIHAVLA